MTLTHESDEPDGPSVAEQITSIMDEMEGAMTDAMELVHPFGHTLWDDSPDLTDLQRVERYVGTALFTMVPVVMQFTMVMLTELATAHLCLQGLHEQEHEVNELMHQSLVFIGEDIKRRKMEAHLRRHGEEPPGRN